MSIIPKNSAKNPLAEFFESREASVRFVGIGGVSMSALAELSCDLGYRVSGSDLCESEHTARLSARGIPVTVGHSPRLARDADLVVYSHAVPDCDPELAAAMEAGVLTVTRAEYMGALMPRYGCRIGISGTHGKSTTVALTEAILTAAGEQPTVLSGASLSSTSSPYLKGGEGILLYEACEYRDSYHHFRPTVAVALGIELDHTDYFPDIASLRRSFTAALSRASDLVVLNSDDENLEAIAADVGVKQVSFGSRHTADYQYLVTSFSERGYGIRLLRRGEPVGDFHTPLLGVFNLTNVTAAIVTSLELGIPTEHISRAVSAFRGIPRRLELIGDYRGRPLYYDYAHHPTAVAASVNALRPISKDGITVVFRPHTYTRTAHLWEDFRAALSLADSVIVTDVYPAREQPIPGVSAPRLAAAIGPRATYAPPNEIESLLRHTRGTVVLMGAGDLEGVKRELLDKNKGN